MLREIPMAEALKHLMEKSKIIVLDGDRVRPIEDVLSGLRFLIDEKPKQKKMTEKTEKEPDPEKEEKKKSTESREQEILAAWNGGQRSIKEIMEMTGASYATVRKYIPVSSKG